MEIIIIIALLGLIPAFIARNKGRSFFGWWLYGALLFIVAIVHALLISARPGSEEAYRQQALQMAAAGYSPARPAPVEFVADGVVHGTPYKQEPDGGVVAIVSGRTIKFRNRQDLEAMLAANRPPA